MLWAVKVRAIMIWENTSSFYVECMFLCFDIDRSSMQIIVTLFFFSIQYVLAFFNLLDYH